MDKTLTELLAYLAKYVPGNKRIYKTIDFGALPNNAKGSKAHGISDISKILSISGIMTNGTSYFALPYINPTALNNGINISYDTTNVSIQTATSWSGYTAKIIIEMSD